MTKAVELFIDGAWTERPAYEAEGWKYKVGPSNVSGLEPNTLEVTFVNDDLSMDPSNVSGPLYGKIGRNTPVRLIDAFPGASLAADTFNGRTTASGWGTSSGGQVWTTAGGAASDYAVASGRASMTLTSINVSRRATIPGSISGGEALLTGITIDIDPLGDDIETTIMFQYQDASNYLQASIYWDRDGRPIELQFVRRVAGVVTQLGITHLTQSPAGASFSCDMRLRWFRNHMNMKVWPSATSEPRDWSLSAIDATWGGGQVGIRANLQPLFSAGTPRVVTFDSFALSAYDAEILSTVEASSWKPSATVAHSPGAGRGRAEIDFTGEGILRRLGRWEEPARSPLNRQINSYDSLLGYWRLEDPPTAQRLSNDVPGAPAGYFSSSGIDLSGDDGAAGAVSAVVIEQGAYMGGAFQFDTSSDGYQLSWLMKLDAIPSSASPIAIMQWSDTLDQTWYWRINNTNFEIGVYDAFSSVVSLVTAAWSGGIDPTQWIRYRMKVSTNGANVTYEPAWYPQDASTPSGFTGSFPGSSTGYPKYWRVAGNAYNDKAAYGHVFGVSDLSLDLLFGYDARQAFNAYNGESAISRFVRNMNENGIGYRYEGDFSKSPIMGRQPRGSLMEILEEIQTTDGGIIHDDPGRLRLIFNTHSAMIAQTPVLALTKGVNVAYPLTKVIDDLGQANDITVTNWDGSEVRLEKTTGSLSVQNPPVGIGRYTGKLDVSFQWVESLEQRGAWELANNTLDRPRYPTVNIDLLANPSLRSTITSLRPGDVISLSGELPDLIYLMVLQIERKGGERPDSVSLSCVPADVWMSGTYDGDARLDSASCVLDEDLTTTETIWDVRFSSPDDRWQPGPGGWDVIVTGERCTVTNVTNGSASGTGWTQSMTCTRSVNGVVKRHLPGEEVHVFQPARYVMANREPQQ